MTWTRLLHLLPLLLLLASCAGKDWGKLARYDLTVPGPTALRLDTARAFAAGVNRLNTYERWIDGEAAGQTSRTLALDRGRWASYDIAGNLVEFLPPESGIAIARAHNRRYNSWIVFDPPLSFAPPLLEQSAAAESTAAFTFWSDSWTTRTGTVEIRTWFAGEEDIDVPAGRLERCARLDSTFKLSFPMGINVWLNQRQWLHPDYGEAMRDMDGDWGLAGAKLGSFTSRHLLAASRTVAAEEIPKLFAEDKLSKRSTRRRPPRGTVARER